MKFQQIKIVNATKNDLKKIIEIYYENSIKPPYNNKWTLKTATLKIHLSFKNTDHIFVAKLGKEVIGFLIAMKYYWWDGWRIYIDEISVSERYQNRGIGKLLLDKIESIAKAKNNPIITLYSDNNAKQATKFYDKYGYKKTTAILRYKIIK